MDINDIKDPSFLKMLDREELDQLASDIRDFLLEHVSHTGGHLSSNLGTVELTIALHKIFDAPKDKILFDVGHQSYTHKILTGRADRFETLRQYGGISGFPKIEESEYDCFEGGHSSNSLSTALGMAISRDLNKQDYEIIPVIGDGAISSGIALEALNQIGYYQKKMIIVFNDNNMSISKNVGALSKGFAKLRSSRPYNALKSDIREFLEDKKYGDTTLRYMRNVKNVIKSSIVDSGIFKDFNIDFLGPVDGHNIAELMNTFQAAKKKDGPVVVHVVTVKGKGYTYTENDNRGIWHGVGPFNVSTGQFLHSDGNYRSASQIVSNALNNEMNSNKDIIAITPAMIHGSKLEKVFAAHPERSFDTGIAEDHALSFAAGLALTGKKPFVAIYSTFLQRAYDQINHDICRTDLPVVLGIDRAGIVGEDGETHQGVFDISFLRPLPHLIIAQGSSAEEINDLVYTAFRSGHPFALRYEKASYIPCDSYQAKELPVGKWKVVKNNENDSCFILSYGQNVNKISHLIQENDFPYSLINCLFIKPIDTELLDYIALSGKPLFLYTEEMIKGGIGDEILEYFAKMGYHNPVHIIGVPDQYVTHGNVNKVKESLHIDLIQLFTIIEKELHA